MHLTELLYYNPLVKQWIVTEIRPEQTDHLQKYRRIFLYSRLHKAGGILVKQQNTLLDPSQELKRFLYQSSTNATSITSLYLYHPELLI